MARQKKKGKKHRFQEQLHWQPLEASYVPDIKASLLRHCHWDRTLYRYSLEKKRALNQTRAKCPAAPPPYNKDLQDTLRCPI
ncbi:MAG: hypothetical protein WA220_05810, partial [Candidatus Nitrosopolaris sp.]